MKCSSRGRPSEWTPRILDGSGLCTDIPQLRRHRGPRNRAQNPQESIIGSRFRKKVRNRTIGRVLWRMHGRQRQHRIHDLPHTELVCLGHEGPAENVTHAMFRLWKRKGFLGQIRAHHRCCQRAFLAATFPKKRRDHPETDGASTSPIHSGAALLLPSQLGFTMNA